MIHGVVIVIWLGVCAVQDIRRRQIANGLTLGVALLALLYLLCTGATWLGAPASAGLLAFALALLFTLPGYALDRFGAGDVKLLAALGLATTVDHVLWSLIGAAITLVGWLVVRQQLGPRAADRVQGPPAKQPFAAFLFAGFVLYGVWTL
ncbi:prepilin peptidase [Pseudomonas sp. JV449]|uniref:prepilin peptidase n=1 Tax=Pseudomonas sp. JV449 TaxID=1890658 RepID=UPI0028E0A8C7|nr:prepilin peptidase [Pseudomonas sp. JV449]MDT9630396.1 prepilin peptidase [Pseudomonas sp. JV449]